MYNGVNDVVSSPISCSYSPPACNKLAGKHAKSSEFTSKVLFQMDVPEINIFAFSGFINTPGEPLKAVCDLKM